MSQNQVIPFKPEKVSFHWMGNASLAMLNATANHLSIALTQTLLSMTQIYVLDTKANASLAQQQYTKVQLYMQGKAGKDVFDNYDAKNDPGIWGSGDDKPSDSSKHINITQMDIANINSWFKATIGVVSSMLSSGTSWLQSTQQNQTSLLTFESSVNDLQDLTANLISSPLA